MNSVAIFSGLLRVVLLDFLTHVNTPIAQTSPEIGCEVELVFELLVHRIASYRPSVREVIDALLYHVRASASRVFEDVVVLKRGRRVLRIAIRN